MVEKVSTALSGKKAYIAAALLALGAVGMFMTDQITGAECFQQVLAAAAVAGLRAGISKAE